jgi:hypothetical protein
VVEVLIVVASDWVKVLVLMLTLRNDTVEGRRFEGSRFARMSDLSDDKTVAKMGHPRFWLCFWGFLEEICF